MVGLPQTAFGALHPERQLNSDILGFALLLTINNLIILEFILYLMHDSAKGTASLILVKLANIISQNLRLLRYRVSTQVPSFWRSTIRHYRTSHLPNSHTFFKELLIDSFLNKVDTKSSIIYLVLFFKESIKSYQQNCPK